MTLFFNTQLSSNLIHNPILHIDTIDDLAQFFSKQPHVKLVSDNRIFTWQLIMNWQGQQGEVIKKRLTNVPTYNYSDVYNGQTIIIGPDIVFLDMMNVNSHLKFHISRDRHYGSQLGLLYSKSIDKVIKYKIDSICIALFESGMIISYKEIRTKVERLKIIDYDLDNDIVT